ncbi:type IV secretion system protein VirB6 [Alphaproteobacteria bacterium]
MLFRHKCVRLIYLITLILCSGCGEECYDANDMGNGKMIVLNARAEKGTNDPPLLRPEPKSHQVVAWRDTGLYTIGTTYDQSGNLVAAAIRGNVRGVWYPWGKGDLAPGCASVLCNLCTNTPCDRYMATCLTPGNGADATGSYIRPSRRNAPCALKNGMGLYGLISIQKSTGGGYSDPNANAETSDAPSASAFRTFHVGQYSINDKGDFAVLYNVVCDPETLQCRRDRQQGVTGDSMALGRLYLKILDNWYGDNAGGYTVQFYDGVYYRGFITDLLSFFNELIRDSAKTVYEQVGNHIVSIARAMLVLYIAITGILFMMGVTQISAQELLMRLFKVGVIVTLISPFKNTMDPESGYTFFNDYLFNLFRAAANSVANVITTSAFFIQQANHHMSGVMVAAKTLSPGASYLVIYDQYITSVFSEAVSAKIWGLLFTSKFYFILAIYFCIVILIITIFRAIVLYAVAFLQVGLLVSVFPIFIIMILFQFTKDLFQNWLRYMLGSALVIVMTTALTALMFVLLKTALDDLLRYGICWKEVFRIIFFPVNFWYPSDFSEVDVALSAANYLRVLFFTLVFYVFMDNVADLADGLSGNMTYGRIADAYRGVTGAAQKTAAFLADELYINKLGDKLHEIHSKYTSAGALVDRGKLQRGFDVIEKVAAKTGTVAKGAEALGATLFDDNESARAAMQAYGAAKQEEKNMIDRQAANVATQKDKDDLQKKEEEDEKKEEAQKKEGKEGLKDGKKEDKGEKNLEGNKEMEDKKDNKVGRDGEELKKNENGDQKNGNIKR